MQKKVLIASAIAMMACVGFLMYVQASPSTVAVDLGPDQTQEAKPGQNVTFDHVLTNTGMTTDTFSLDAVSSQNWPVALVSHVHPTPTQVLTLELGAQLSTTFQLSLTVPPYAGGMTDVTLITATSHLSPTVRDTVIDTTSVTAMVYLPLVMRRWPPLPYQPTMSPISNPDGTGSYVVSWTEQPSRLAHTYTLEEATNSSFTSDLRDVCTTSNQSCHVIERTAGTYYYRVRGHNNWGYGQYSAVRSVQVLPPAVPWLKGIDNSDGDGTYTVSWGTAARANNYVLQEATHPDFTSATKVYEGPNLSWEATGKNEGTYYYRLRAWGPTGHSEWSVTRSVKVLPPAVPWLKGIDNADSDRTYTVSWGKTARASNYVLQEATNSDFTGATKVYEGPNLSWDALEKDVGTYYYRVRAWGPTGPSEWSNTRQITIHPLFVGLQLRWDGSGYVRGSEYYNIGSHMERECDALTDQDTIRCRAYSWYNPNPLDLDSERWDSYYSVSTGRFKSTSSPADPSWKWSLPWVLPYGWAFHHGQTFDIGGQPFRVTGPHSGYTAFGQAVKYWKLVNKDKFLYWDGGGDWKQYVLAGDVTLHYDAGNSRLLLHRDILRTYYYKGDRRDDTVQYITNLTSANAFPSAPEPPPANTPTPEPTPVGYYYYDDFGSPNSGWPIVLDDQRWAFYEIDPNPPVPADGSPYPRDGHAYFVARRGSSSPPATFGPSVPIPSADYQIEVDARWWDARWGATYQILFGANQSLTDYYAVRVQMDDLQNLCRFSIVKRTGYQTTFLNGDWEAHRSIDCGQRRHDSGTPWNQWIIQRQGNSIRLLVNGTVLGQWTDSSFGAHRYFGVRATLYEGFKPSKAEFDNWGVKLLD